MSISGIDRITYGTEAIEESRRFFLDWGLELVAEGRGFLDFETLNGCQVRVRRVADTTLPPPIEDGATLREVVWGVDAETDLEFLAKKIVGLPDFKKQDGLIGCRDPNGLGTFFRVCQKRKVDIKGSPSNTWDHAARIDMPSPVYDRARPIEVGHVVLFTTNLMESTEFYEQIGFCVSDRYPGRGHFLRTSKRGGHHDLFLLQAPPHPTGLNHVAFTVRDIHEVIGGGIHFSRCGWSTQIGPGRHPISSAYFWYFENPAGGLAEYYADEDVLTEKWQPRDFTPSPDLFAEWAVIGGIDGASRRQKQGPTSEK